MHALQSLQGLQIDAIIAHGKIRTFDERVTQIAGEQNMLEISFVVRTRGQKRDHRRLAVGRRQRRQLLLQSAEKICQPLHAEGAENVFVQRRDDEPVLQRVTGARRALGAIVDHPPSAVGRAGEIAGVQVKVSSAARLDAAARPKIIIMAMNDRRRD